MGYSRWDIDHTAASHLRRLHAHGDGGATADDEVDLVLGVWQLRIEISLVEGVEAGRHIPLAQELEVRAVIGGPLGLQLIQSECLHRLSAPAIGPIVSVTIRDMMNFLVKTIANAVALAVAIWLISDITLTGDSTGRKALALIVVALIFGLVNVVVKPIVQLLTVPLFILTLGLITLVVNALMLLLTSWLADKLDLNFHVEGFWTAVLGGLIISVVSWALNVALPDKE